MRRLVIDANILASGSVDPHGESPPSLIYRNLDSSHFEAIVCPELLGEVADALRKPYFLDRIGNDGVDDLVVGIAEAATVVNDPIDPPSLLRDPDDDYLVALALGAGAEAIVTGDRDLLGHQGIEPPALDARTACKLVGLVT